MIRSTALLCCCLLMLAGCSRYSDYSSATRDMSVSESDNREWIADTVFGTIEVLCSAFDDQAAKTRTASERMPLVTITDLSGQITTVYAPAPDPAMAIYMAGRAKADIIRELKPIITEFTKDLSIELGRPVTVEDVAMRVAQDTGLIAAIGGMWSLGVEGIKAAQGTITANLSGGSSFAKDGATSSGQYAPWTDNSDNSTSIPEESAE